MADYLQQTDSLIMANGGGMKRADVERFKLYTGLSRYVLYRVL